MSPGPGPGAGRGPVGPLAAPAVILAADHRARGVITIEAYAPYLQSLSAALEFCDGILATTQPLRDLSASGAVEVRHRTYLSLNRTGLAGSAFELDDRLVASVEQASSEGWTGIKHMTRIDMTDPQTAPALELLGTVLESARASGLEALIEPLTWTEGKVARDTDSIVFAAIVAHDLGAPVLKVPVPDVAPGAARIDAVARIVGSVGVPVLFLGGPRRGGVGEVAGGGSAVGDSGGGQESRELVLNEIRDSMAGGAAGLAVGRVVFQDPDPATMARLVAEAVRDVAGAIGGTGAAGAAGTVSA
jgi:DhnA family fructose-bisphosphate aldolase class Ia